MGSRYGRHATTGGGPSQMMRGAGRTAATHCSHSPTPGVWHPGQQAPSSRSARLSRILMPSIVASGTARNQAARRSVDDAPEVLEGAVDNPHCGHPTRGWSPHPYRPVPRPATPGHAGCTPVQSCRSATPLSTQGDYPLRATAVIEASSPSWVQRYRYS